jgi:hypothetical protein
MMALPAEKGSPWLAATDSILSIWIVSGDNQEPFALETILELLHQLMLLLIHIAIASR